MLKPKKKFSKKELRQDKFVTATFKAQSYLQENRNTVISYVAAVAILFVAVLWFTGQAQTDRLEAGTLVTRGQIAFEQGREMEGVAYLEEAVKDYSNDPAGSAAFLLGKYFFGKAEYDTAAYFLGYALDYTDDPLVVAPASMLLGSVEQIRGDDEAALGYYQEAAEHASFPAMRANALYNQALTQEMLGNTKKSLELYEKIADEYRDFEYIDDVKYKIVKLKASL